MNEAHYLMLVQNPDDGSWMLMTDTVDRAELDREYAGRKGSNIICIDTSDYVMIA